MVSTSAFLVVISATELASEQVRVDMTIELAPNFWEAKGSALKKSGGEGGKLPIGDFYAHYTSACELSPEGISCAWVNHTFRAIEDHEQLTGLNPPYDLFVGYLPGTPAKVAVSLSAANQEDACQRLKRAGYRDFHIRGMSDDEPSIAREILKREAGL